MNTPGQVKFPHVKVQLVGRDGNAFSTLGRVRRAMTRAGVPREEVSAFMAEATAGDYDHLLATCMRWVDVEGDEEEADEDEEAEPVPPLAPPPWWPATGGGVALGSGLSDRDRVHRMFRLLRERGVFARLNWQCCQGCGWAAVAKRATPGQPVAFCHQQDMEAFDGQRLARPLYVAFGVHSPPADADAHALEVDTGEVLVQAAHHVGLEVVWNGTPTMRVGLEGAATVH